jgi:hypothetical protein
MKEEERLKKDIEAYVHKDFVENNALRTHNFAKFLGSCLPGHRSAGPRHRRLHLDMVSAQMSSAAQPANARPESM